jgi:hypothetical protein
MAVARHHYRGAGQLGQTATDRDGGVGGHVLSRFKRVDVLVLAGEHDLVRVEVELGAGIGLIERADIAADLCFVGRAWMWVDECFFNVAEWWDCALLRVLI